MSWRWAATSAMMMLLALCVRPTAGWSQDQAAAPADDDAVVEASSDDLEALVAPVALYPDPILMLVLQGSVLPLQIVQADRFLDAHEKDAKAVPPDGLDPAVVGLLNYPAVVGQMSDYLDWTQSMGEAVVDQLDDVQVAIQGVRQTAYALGMLKSNDQQKVIVDGPVIRIMPTSGTTVAIPIYDAGALLEAGEAADEAAALEETATEPAPAPAPQPAPATDTAPATAPAATQAFAPETAPSTAPIAYAPAPAAVAPPPVAYSEPQNTFWSSAATFAGGAAMGGLLGYILADDDDNDDVDWDDINDEMEDLFDDEFDDFTDDMRNELRDAVDDADFDDLSNRLNGGREINVSDSNIVVGNQVRKRENMQNELRARQNGSKQGLGTRKEREKKLADLRATGGDGGLTLPRSAGPKPAATRSAKAAPSLAAAAPKVQRQVALPKGDGKRRPTAAAQAPTAKKQVASTQQRAKVQSGRGNQAAAKATSRNVAQSRSKPAAFTPANPRREVNRDRARGQESRAEATRRRADRPAAVTTASGNRAQPARPNQGNRGMQNAGGSGKAAKAASNRGKQSRGGGGGGKRRGG